MLTLVLDPSEPFCALREQLLADRSSERRLVLIPPGQPPVNPDLLLVLLRRLADRERLTIGLVSDDSALRRQAAALGLPAFRNIQSADEQERSWHKTDCREQVGFGWAESHRPPESA